MAKKAKFDQDATFKSIVGIGLEQPSETGGAVTEEKTGSGSGKPNRVQRAYYLDRDIEKALRRKALEEDINLTRAVNDALRLGLAKYL